MFFAESHKSRTSNTEHMGRYDHVWGKGGRKQNRHVCYVFHVGNSLGRWQGPKVTPIV